MALSANNVPKVQITSTDNFLSLIKYLISHYVSYGIVVGASILKVPQILNIYRSQSAAGISITSYYIDLFVYIIATSWGLAQQLHFRDFGENAFILTQVVGLIVMVAKLQQKTHSASIVLAINTILFSVLSKGYVSRSLHERLLRILILLSLCSRVPQIILNYKNQSTGQLSFLSFFLAFGGSLARVMTTMLNVPWQKGKAIMLSQFIMSTILNIVIIAQIVYYNYSRKRSLDKKNS